MEEKKTSTEGSVVSGTDNNSSNDTTDMTSGKDIADNSNITSANTEPAEGQVTTQSDKATPDDLVDDTIDKVEEVNESNDVAEVQNETKKSSSLKTYLIAGLLIIVIAFGLLFVLERNGSVNTGLFASVIEGMEARKPAAKVNGEVITVGDLNSGVQQLVEIATLQGVDTSDETMKEQFREQALNTLVNGEVLRQKALAEGVTADQSQIDQKFNEISESVGGIEILNERMLEFGITEVSLRRDIENEILIQGLFDSVFPDVIEVSDEEVSAFYTDNGGEEAGLPPLEEIESQIKEQVRLTKENEQIGEYIDTLREEAEIEILI